MRCLGIFIVDCEGEWEDWWQKEEDDDEDEVMNAPGLRVLDRTTRTSRTTTTKLSDYSSHLVGGYDDDQVDDRSAESTTLDSKLMSDVVAMLLQNADIPHDKRELCKMAGAHQKYNRGQHPTKLVDHAYLLFVEFNN